MQSKASVFTATEGQTCTDAANVAASPQLHQCKCRRAYLWSTGDDSSGAVLVMARTQGEKRMGLVFRLHIEQAWQTVRKMGFCGLDLLFHF